MFKLPNDVLQYLTTAPATLLVAPDVPKFTILYANPAYHQVTLTTPSDIVGLGFLEAFPESPEDPEGDNLEVLLNSLIECVDKKSRVELPGKRYDVPIRGTDRFETKYWQASNNPVINDEGEISYISHVTVEITGAYDLAKKERIAREVSEAKRRDLHSLLMEAPAAIAILEGPEFVYEFQNSLHKRLFPGRNLIGKGLVEAFPEFKDAPIIQILKNVYHNGEPSETKELMIPLTREDHLFSDNVFWNFIYQPRYNSSNEVDGIVIFGYDVTGQVSSRTKVEESEKRLQTILETLAEGLVIVNREGTMVFVNTMAEQLLGLSKEAMLERNYHDPRWQNLRLDGSDLPKDEHPIYITMNTGETVFDREIGIKRADGDHFFISVNSAPLRNDAGEITGAIGTFIDVTQRRRSAQMKDEFVSTVSHELKTPLTSIKAYLQMLDRSVGGAEVNSRRFLDRLSIQVNRLETLIKDFLDVTRIDSDKLQLRATEFDMKPVLEDLIKDLQMVNNTHKLIITHNQSVKVVTDQNRVIQVLTNLITNAVKYSPAAKEVRIALRTENDEMVCSVQDFGIGIPEGQKSLVFDRFHQAGHNKGSGLSLGLGLYISREIVNRAGGRIWLDSVPGEGSTFYFSLPLLA